MSNPGLLSENTDTIQQLKILGMDNSEAAVYLFLVARKTSSALNISRGTNISRTRVYKILSDLVQKGFVKEIIDLPGSKFEVSPAQDVQRVIDEQDNKLKQLKDAAPDLLQKLQSLNLQNAANSKVVYYKGEEGLKQITLNSLNADKFMRIFEIGEGMQTFSDEKFAENVRRQIFKRELFVRQLTNIKNYPAYTKIDEFVRNSTEMRYVDPKEITLEFELLIYDDVVAIYTYRESEYFGIEIYSKDLAHMQSQLFDFIWKNAQKMKIGEGGSARLDNRYPDLTISDRRFR